LESQEKDITAPLISTSSRSQSSTTESGPGIVSLPSHADIVNLPESDRRDRSELHTGDPNDKAGTVTGTVIADVEEQRTTLYCNETLQDIAQTIDSCLQRPVIDVYPYRQFGKKKKRFNHRHYASFSWLEYSVKLDAAFCFPCRFFSKDKGPFSEKGFSDWNHIAGDGYGFSAHNCSASHRFAVVAWEKYKFDSVTNSSVIDLLNSGNAEMRKSNRLYIKTLTEIILFCGRQEIALRGDNEEVGSLNRGNFLELVQLVAKHDAAFARRLNQLSGNATYLSPQIQNDIIVSISDAILDTVCDRVTKSGCFALLADETKDASKTEQISIILRFVDCDSCIVEERFIGFVSAASCNAESLTKYLVDTVTRFGLSMKQCVAQSYDGASVMSGTCTGVQARIQECAPMAVYIHCMAHRLNLVLVDVCKNIQCIAEFFVLLEAVYVFMSSGVSHPIFIETQRRLYPNRRPMELKRLIETRWSCRFQSIETLLKTYSAVLNTLADVRDTHHSPERSALAAGYLLKLESFPFVLMLVIMERLMRVAFILSNALQDPELDLAAAVTLINNVVRQLTEMRGCNEGDNTNEWDEIWSTAHKICQDNHIEIDVPDSVVQPAENVRRQARTCKPPSWLDSYLTTESSGARRDHSGTSASLSVTADCRKNGCRVSVYIVVIDRMLIEMKKRFGPLQNSFFSAIQALQPKSANFMMQEIIQPMIAHYRNFLSHKTESGDSSSCDTDLLAEISHVKGVLQEIAPDAETMLDVLRALKPLRAAFPRVIKLYRLALTLPVSTASCERSFSCIKRVKTYTRTTMTAGRLTGLALMSIENELTKTDTFINEVLEKFKNQGGINRRIAI
jgi:hypothetical protein